MTIWDTPEIQEAEKKEQSNSPFISKMAVGETKVMKFVNLLHKEQDPSIQYPSADGMCWEFWLADKKGKEQSLNQGTTKGKFFQSMKKSNVETGDIIKITRQEEEGYPLWIIEKLSDWPEESLMEQTKEFRKEPVSADEVPF